MLYEFTDEILRRRGKNWEIIADNYILQEFLSRGGDYRFWFTERNPEDNDAQATERILKCSGGNIINWDSVSDNIIELSDQLSNDQKPCRIKLDTLWNVINKLGKSRKS